jgi:glycosyltransferase involved in cell wall biosynthesis
MIRTANLTHSVSRKAGGLHESVRRLVQSLAQGGVEVEVLTTEDEFTEMDLEVWAPVPVHVFPSSWPEPFGYSPQFLRLLNEHKPDLTHTHGLWLYPSIATTIYCSQCRVPYMISPHGMVDPWAVRNHRWRKIIAYALFESNHIRGARCIRALCDSEAKSIRQLGLHNPVAVIPNGVDLPEAGASGAEAKMPWEGLGSPGRKTLLFLSRIHRKKGIDNLLRAWASQKGAGGWLLVIVGWDEEGHEAQLKKLCTELGIGWRDARETKVDDERPEAEPSVLFMGPCHRAKKAACYRYCDAFILPSHSEGLPMVILEAWAYAKPVLMTPACNLPEGFAAGAAIRLDPTVEGVEKGLRQLFETSGSELAEMGRHGKALVEDRFTWDKVTSQVKETYEWMLGGGPAPNCLFDPR